jgi:DNA-binding LytR/AlgR family response regulator
VWPELRVVARAANGIEALAMTDEHAPDVVFLDIRMPGLTGLDVAARLVEGGKPPHIVFVTAFDQYAVEAFEHSAVDYLLKPASLERLEKTVAKLKARLASLTCGAGGGLAGLLAQLSAAPAAARPPRAAAMDTRLARRRNPPDSDRGRDLLPEQRQIHQRVRGGWREPDTHADQQAARAAR